MIIFSTQNFILLIAALINLAMSLFIFSRGTKNKVNFYFGLLTFFNFLWAFSLLMSKLLHNDLTAEIFYRTSYFSAIGIAVSLYYFCLHYPYKNKVTYKVVNFFIILGSLFLSILVYTKIHVVSFARSQDLTNWQLVYNRGFYVIYSLIFFVLIVSAIYFLVDKLKWLDDIYYKQIRSLIITIIVGLFFGSYFNLVLCYFNNWDYIWLGPIFTLFMNMVVFRSIIAPKEKISN